MTYTTDTEGTTDPNEFTPTGVTSEKAASLGIREHLDLEKIKFLLELGAAIAKTFGELPIEYIDETFNDAVRKDLGEFAEEAHDVAETIDSLLAVEGLLGGALNTGSFGL